MNPSPAGGSPGEETPRELALPFTAAPAAAPASPGGRSGSAAARVPVFAVNATGAAGAVAASLSPTAAISALPGLGAWSLDCRRKTLRGVLRAWLLKSRKSVR